MQLEALAYYYLLIIIISIYYDFFVEKLMFQIWKKGNYISVF